MKIHYIEGHGNGFNWGKWMLGRFEPSDLAVRSAAFPELRQSLVAGQGWGPEHYWVVDLATGEGALFLLGGFARADLNKTKIHVCVLFEAFLTWLYQHRRELRRQHPEDWWDTLPATVELPEAEAEFYGYRRRGFHTESGDAAVRFSG